MTGQPQVSELVERYRENAAKHGASTQTGDSVAANAAYAAMVEVLRALRALGPEALRALLVLLEDPDIAVRGWAATHALEFAPESAEGVLEAIAGGPPGPFRLDAEITLREWRAGRLVFP